ncbi:hypothetical protein TNCV_387261 [Trichonephila clavipes]|nr:hypothetical protein TNCV_387261 [Trichonephila clavipes]
MPRGRHWGSFDHVFEFDRGRIIANRGIADYPSEKPVNVLDETKPSNADLSLLDAGGNERRTHVVAQLPLMTVGLCAWQ